MSTDRHGRDHLPAGAPTGGRFFGRTRADDEITLSAPSALTIPAIGTETRNWHPLNPDAFSRAEVQRQTGPYESAIPATLADATFTLDGELAADLDEASIALRDFDQHALLRLGADGPALGPMSAILLRTESASSSQIEQLTTSARQLALAEIDEGDRANARAVIGNVRAMEAALRLAGSLDQDAILAMHRELVADQWSMREEAGHFRQQLVWVGGRDSAGPRSAEYIAPQPERIPDAIDDLLQFARRGDVPPLLRVAIVHAQFETIHPFVDGNGRTGRALAQAMLHESGLAVHTTAPLSAGLLTDTDTYFDALNAYRTGDAGPIVRAFAGAARYAASTGIRLVDDLAAELDRSRAALDGLRPQSAAWKVLPALIGQPVINGKFLKNRFAMNDRTAARTLQTLAERGVLRERTGMSRNRIWQHDGILNVLDDYAAQIHRTPSS